MGFGSYDESDQEQPKQDDEESGEDFTEIIKGTNSDAKGKESVKESSVEDMMEHL